MQPEWGIFGPKGLVEGGFGSLEDAEHARWTRHRQEPELWVDEVWATDKPVDGNGDQIKES